MPTPRINVKAGYIKWNWSVWVLAYTAVITVGIDFSKEWFHLAVMHVHSAAQNAQSCVQSLLRVRKLVDERISLYIHTIVWCPGAHCEILGL